MTEAACTHIRLKLLILYPLSFAAATLGNNQFAGYGINGLAGGNITYATTGNFYGGIRVWTSQVRGCGGRPVPPSYPSSRQNNRFRCI
jgi:hypothetical protein